MGKLLDKLHECVAEDGEEADADREAYGITRVKRGVYGQIGEGKRYPDQHGVDGYDRQGESQNYHAYSSRLHQTVWSDGVKVGQGASGIGGGGAQATTHLRKM